VRQSTSLTPGGAAWLGGGRSTCGSGGRRASRPHCRVALVDRRLSRKRSGAGDPFQSHAPSPAGSLGRQAREVGGCLPVWHLIAVVGLCRMQRTRPRSSDGQPHGPLSQPCDSWWVTCLNRRIGAAGGGG
jgi:hypothetical protein